MKKLLLLTMVLFAGQSIEAASATLKNTADKVWSVYINGKQLSAGSSVNVTAGANCTISINQYGITGAGCTGGTCIGTAVLQSKISAGNYEIANPVRTGNAGQNPDGNSEVVFNVVLNKK